MSLIRLLRRSSLVSSLGSDCLGAKLGAKWGQTILNIGQNQLTAGKYVVEKTGAPAIIYGSGTKGRRCDISGVLGVPNNQRTRLCSCPKCFPLHKQGTDFQPTDRKRD